MQAAAAGGARRRPQPRGTAAAAATAAAHLPASSLPAALDAEALSPAACRICWAEADGEPGGALLSPCRCRGSSHFVHQRCLSAWMASVAERKGVHWANHCDVCRSRYVG